MKSTKANTQGPEDIQASPDGQESGGMVQNRRYQSRREKVRKTDSLLSGGARAYTMGTILLLYVILMVWMYMLAPVLLIVLGVIAAVILIAGTLERWQPKDTASRREPHTKSD